MKREVFDAHRSQSVLKNYIEVPESQVVNSFGEIKMNAPFVLKIIAPDLIHKTEAGAVKIVNRIEEAEPSFNELIKVAKTNKIKIKGILVQKFIEGQQLIIGLKKDHVFGQVILFGLGGIFTEILDDVSIRKCPINLEEASDMIKELRSKKLFEGFRGINLNVDLLKKDLVSISKIPDKNKNIVELDINPYILNSKEGKAVDIRIVTEN